MLELLPEVVRGIIMDREQEDAGLGAKDITGLSREDAGKRMREIEHRINTLEWDSRMNQIHPFRLYQLKRLKEEKQLIKEYCTALTVE